MTYWDIDMVLDFLRDGGQLALEIQKGDSWDFKQDHSLVTEADRQVEALARERFLTQGSWFIGEETIETDSEEDIQQALKGPTWILDPIDGTAPFANNLPTWGVSLGFMEGGILTEGAIYYPALNIFLFTNGGSVYIQEEGKGPRKITATTAPFNEGRMLCIPQDVTKKGRFSGSAPIQVNGSCVYSMLELLRGHYAGYMGRVKVWDLAAGWPILRTAGVKAFFYKGKETLLELNERDFVLKAGSPKRWRTRHHVIYANNQEARHYLDKHIHLGD